MSVTFALTEGDLRYYSHYTRMHVPSVRRTFVSALLGVPVALIGVNVVLWADARVAVPVVLAASLIWWVFILWRFTWYTLKRAREFPGFFAEQTTIIGPDGCSQLLATSSSLVKWAAIREIIEAPEQILFFLTPKLAFIVPKRAFADPAHAQRFIGLAKSYWQQESRSG